MIESKDISEFYASFYLRDRWTSDLVVKYDFSYFDHGAGYYGMGSMTPADEEPDSDSAALMLYIEYGSGKNIRIDTKKASEIEGMSALLAELAAYHDSLF